ncbi:helicase-related protein [Conexivisphaera calida]|uniref:helicase-related protein n=1 Tax=Conexivisphaera calida TaxID=1874277 RepID=UPI00157B94FC|nr:helicase-related protein [Conexivisphaera calida]
MDNPGLALRALRMDYMFNDTPCVQASLAKVDALPHQIGAVRSALGMAMSQGYVRLMIADDVGLGKTIEAGMIARELMARGRVGRILIVVPKSLALQWERELGEKFGVEAAVAWAGKELQGAVAEDVLIVPLGLARRRKNLEVLRRARWDLAIFDEAHNLTTEKVGQRVRKTRGYVAAEALAGSIPNVLLLTATPHHGKPVDFRYRLRLLDPNVPLDESSSIGEFVSRLVVRRLREEVRGYDGRPLIPGRESDFVRIRFNDAEREAYLALLDYVKEYYDLYRKTERRSYGLVAVVLQKRASSSMRALLRSLERRKGRLEAMLRGELRADPEEVERSVGSLGGLSPREEQYVIENVAGLDLQREVRVVEGLIGLCRAALGSDSKLRALREDVLGGLARGDAAGRPEKVIVFTQYRDTLEYLYDQLSKSGVGGVVKVHGRMGPDERMRAEESFRRQDGARVLIATDVASEGLNLQVARFMVNYDLPWNPTRLDQRIGRIHRYGQRGKVLAISMLVEDTVDNRIYEVLMEKLGTIREELGHVFDYAGLLIDESDLEAAVERAVVAGAERAAEELYEDVMRRKDAVVELEELLDRNRIRIPEGDPRCPEGDAIGEEEVRGFVLDAMSGLDPKCFQYDRGRDVFALVHAGCLEGGTVEVRPFRGTFSRDALASDPGLEYIGVEHPLVRRLLEILRPRGQLVLEAENKSVKGWLWLVRVEDSVRGVPVDCESNRTTDLSSKRVVALLEDEGRGRVVEVGLSAIDNLYGVQRWSGQPKDPPVERLEAVEGEVRREVDRVLEVLRTDVISRYTAEINRLSGLQRSAADVMERQRYASRLHAALDRQLDCTGRIDGLRESGHAVRKEVLAAIGLYPFGYSELGLDYSERLLESGRKGEELVMRCEKEEGASLEDLRDKFTAGVDLISYRPDGEVRYIEVKTVSGPSSKVYITQREWDVMSMSGRRRQRYLAELAPRELSVIARQSVYLYIVDLQAGDGCGSILRVKDPYGKLRDVVEKYKRFQFKIEIPYEDMRRILGL